MIEIFFDGLCEPFNPSGTACYGFVVYRDRKRIYAGKDVIGEGKGMTNNVAEFSALLKAIEWLVQRANSDDIPIDEDIVIRGDSQLVIQQVSGSWRVKSATSRKYVPMIRDLLKQRKGKIGLKWIPRDENTEADRLSRVAYDEYNNRR